MKLATAVIESRKMVKNKNFFLTLHRCFQSLRGMNSSRISENKKYEFSPPTSFQHFKLKMFSFYQIPPLTKVQSLRSLQLFSAYKICFAKGKDKLVNSFSLFLTFFSLLCLVSSNFFFISKQGCCLSHIGYIVQQRDEQKQPQNRHEKGVSHVKKDQKCSPESKGVCVKLWKFRLQKMLLDYNFSHGNLELMSMLGLLHAISIFEKVVVCFCQTNFVVF